MSVPSKQPPQKTFKALPGELEYLTGTVTNWRLVYDHTEGPDVPVYKLLLYVNGKIVEKYPFPVEKESTGMHVNMDKKFLMMVVCPSLFVLKYIISALSAGMDVTLKADGSVAGKFIL